ncbi:SusD/RagB family nutrient-binding outer membrane lipoprotein [Pedobacter caeni]|uniref:Susd and RagB outer membrane lipoprotein n=1 Tax=Pedobacter caeni TaxID=288992 RepID=A0A1M5MQW9_9SPHI|nr:SusD/RagB family nutrient-binding outer membrane lipoprotein [Pedobacter caeni]SHG79289.1 Susd and RagB outer membrane lipoprotein [Pedobacter caeni]
MILENIKKTGLALLLTTVVFSSCSEDVMDRINEDRNNPLTSPARFIITDAIASSAFKVAGSDYAFYASVYMENHVGIYGQMYNAEIRTAEPYLSTTYDNAWSAAYTNLRNLKVAIDKCSPGGIEDGNFQALGIAQVLSAYNLAIQTDLMGDIPWTEAIQPAIILQPKIDKQEAIYADVMKFLDDAIVNLGKNSAYASLEGQDLLYKGNNKAWVKMAHGLKARYKMRLSFRSAKYQEVINEVDLSFAEASEQASFKFNGGTSNNPFYSFANDRDYFGASTSLHEKLVARTDPRDALFFTSYPVAPNKPAKPLIFAPNGGPRQQQEYYGISGLLSASAPTHLLSYHELLFLKAEAYSRLGDKFNAEKALKAAIAAAFVKVGLTEEAAGTYYADKVEGLFNANPTKEIMAQKYLAFFEDEAVESYNDYRRLKAMGNGDYIPLSNTKSFPLRFTYGSSDVTTNDYVKAAYGDGQYVKTENVWWAGGTR